MVGTMTLQWDSYCCRYIDCLLTPTLSTFVLFCFVTNNVRLRTSNCYWMPFGWHWEMKEAFLLWPAVQAETVVVETVVAGHVEFPLPFDE